MEQAINLVGEVFLALARLAFPWRAKARYIVMLGGPGTGKGTMTELLEPRTGLKKLGTGALVRAYIETRRGRKWAAHVKGGGLLPTWIILWLVFKELRKPKYDNGAILDGVPRTRWQAFCLRLMLAFWGHRFGDAVLLEVPEADIVERLALRRTCKNKACNKTYHIKFNPPKKEGVCDKCGSELEQRADDHPDSVKERLRLFSATSGPLNAYFEEMGILHRITSTNDRSVDQVLEDVYFSLEESD